MLDLFSGSGIIGFEALSRGAKTITFVDSSLRVNSLLKMNSILFKEEEINSIHGPIGIKLGGKSAPEIALSIISQLVSEVYKK